MQASCRYFAHMKTPTIPAANASQNPRTTKEIQRDISALGFPNRGSRKMLRQEELRHELRRAKAAEIVLTAHEVAAADAPSSSAKATEPKEALQIERTEEDHLRLERDMARIELRKTLRIAEQLAEACMRLSRAVEALENQELEYLLAVELSNAVGSARAAIATWDSASPKATQSKGNQ
jgi:hypothetical protein